MGYTPQRLALLDVCKRCSSCFWETSMPTPHLQVWGFLSNRARMRETKQMGIFQRPVREDKGCINGLKGLGQVL
jgi:hypothetical protein